MIARDIAASTKRGGRRIAPPGVCIQRGVVGVQVRPLRTLPAGMNFVDNVQGRAGFFSQRGALIDRLRTCRYRAQRLASDFWHETGSASSEGNHQSAFLPSWGLLNQNLRGGPVCIRGCRVIKTGPARLVCIRGS